MVLPIMSAAAPLRVDFFLAGRPRKKTQQGVHAAAILSGCLPDRGTIRQFPWLGRGHERSHAHPVRPGAGPRPRRRAVVAAGVRRAAPAGGGAQRFALSESDRVVVPDPDTLLTVDEALAKLACEDAVSAEVARLRLFGDGKCRSASRFCLPVGHLPVAMPELGRSSFGGRRQRGWRRYQFLEIRLRMARYLRCAWFAARTHPTADSPVLEHRRWLGSCSRRSSD